MCYSQFSRDTTLRLPITCSRIMPEKKAHYFKQPTKVSMSLTQHQKDLLSQKEKELIGIVMFL